MVHKALEDVAQPFAAYELTVSHQMVDGVLPGKTDEPVYEFNPLLGVGVPRLSIILNTILYVSRIRQ